MIPKHVTIKLVNVLLGVVANTSASPVQYDPKLDKFLCHVMEESGASSLKRKRAIFCFTLRIQ